MVKNNVTGLILAAGLSQRMGAFKPLMNFQGKPFVVSIINKLLDHCGKIIVVTGCWADELTGVIKANFDTNQIKLEYNPDYEKGMFTSLRKGVAAAQGNDWVLYHFIDQPFFTNAFYSEFVSQIDVSYDWIQPSYNGRPGHPIMFGKKVSDLIINSLLQSSLREIKNNHAVIRKEWACSYPEVLIDFDTKESMDHYYLGLQDKE